MRKEEHIGHTVEVNMQYVSLTKYLLSVKSSL